MIIKKATPKGYIEVSGDGKNELPKGTILQQEGYSNPRSVIVHNYGINEKYENTGSRYMTIDLENYSQHQIDAFQLQFIDEKDSNRIQIYITDEIMPENEMAEVWMKSETIRQTQQSAQNIAEEKRKQHLEKGRILFDKLIPKEAKALIIAEKQENQSDYHTDYFGHKTTETVILGWSKHTRDLFPEMRKHADRLPETAHLKHRPTLNSNGEERTEENKGWWVPKDEHREKWSGGGGFYLKDGSRNKTGWSISKQAKWGKDWNEGLYVSLSKRCVLKHKK